MTKQNRIILCIILGVILLCIAIYILKREESLSRGNLYTAEYDEFEGDEEDDDDQPVPKGMAKYSLFIVPAIQPKQNKKSKTWGGYHITLFPTNIMPENYSIVKVMERFRSKNEPWNLMNKSIKISLKDAKTKNIRLMYMSGEPTIDKLKRYLQSNSTGQQPWVKPWGKPHVTLGTLNPFDQAKPSDFLTQDTWYVQLVRKHDKGNGGYFVPGQRARLYVTA